MRILFARITGVTAAILLLGGCSGRGTNDEPTAGSGRAGGSMTGAGGAGPGYDGSGTGAGQEGTVPDSGAAKQRKSGNTQTNTAMGNTTESPQLPAPQQTQE